MRIRRFERIKKNNLTLSVAPPGHAGFLGRGDAKGGQADEGQAEEDLGGVHFVWKMQEKGGFIRHFSLKTDCLF